jgi:hypothetical protein
MATNNEAGADRNEIVRAIRILFEPDQVVEVRVPGKFGAVSGYFDDHEKLAKAIKRLSDENDQAGVYITLNPCHNGVLARRFENSLHEDVKETTSDADIVRRRWLLIDFDPKRPRGVSATTPEKQAARKTMLAVRTWLHREGWAQPVIADSGNGFHLLYRVDEPNDEGTKQLFRQCLAALSERFSTLEVVLDTAVYNAARITKAYGSLAAKGESTPDRPHRYSKLALVPEAGLKMVHREQLEALAAKDTPPDKESVKGPGKNRESAPVDSTKVDEFLQWGGVEVKLTKPIADGGMQWILAACPFNPEHTNGPAVSWKPTGELGFHCWHQSCSGYHWKEFREQVESRKGEKFRFSEGNNALAYEATPAGIVWRKLTSDGERLVPLTNFTARIVADIAEDDGVDLKHSLEIEATCKGRTRTFCVPTSGFMSMNWPLEQLGGEAIIAAGAGLRDHARAAVQSLSGDMDHRRVFLHTGWRPIDGSWFYLHAGGAVGAEGLQTNVSVKLPSNLTAFRLPPPPAGESLQSAIRASLRFLDLAPRRLTVPVYAAIWRSVLLKVPVGPNLRGSSGDISRVQAFAKSAV